MTRLLPGDVGYATIQLEMKEGRNMETGLNNAIPGSPERSKIEIARITGDDDKLIEIVSKLSDESLERLHKILKGS